MRTCTLTRFALVGLACMLAAFAAGDFAQGQSPEAEALKAAKPQTTCPIMGQKIDPKLYTDVEGQRIYVCCPGCIDKIEQDPKAALAKIAANGETAERLPTRLCGTCGEIKGTEACCAKDAKACGKCGLHKGAPGCCKIEKGEDAALCRKCGEIKGTEACCAKDAEACGKCGLHKGAPGCCKLPARTWKCDKNGSKCPKSARGAGAAPGGGCARKRVKCGRCN